MPIEFENIDPAKEVQATTPEVNQDAAKRVLAQTKQNYILKGFSLQRLQTAFFAIPDQDEDDPLQSNLPAPGGGLGLPIWTNLEFQGGAFQDLNSGEVIQYQPVRLDTVLMSVSMTKNIVTTAIQGKSGTVKEFASDGDYEIEVRGALIGAGHNEYPQLEMEELQRILTVPATLKVNSDFLLNFGVITPDGVEGIEEVVITDFNFPQREGSRNVQLYQFKMLSNTPIELTI